MRPTVRLTAAQAIIRYLAALRCVPVAGEAEVPLFGGVFAIFGHGNVAGIGEALHRYRDVMPTFRAHNEQGMALAAIAYAKANFRRRIMACTTSIGPGATNLATAAALAHVNRLPLLLLPGDVFVSRAPDPVLQQIEDFTDATVSANDCLRPFSRYFDRIVHPAQLLSALPQAIATMTDPASCGPATLCLPQDVQAMAYDYPEVFFVPRRVEFRDPPPTDDELARAIDAIRSARRPVLVAGGGVLYGLAADALRAFAETHGVPVAETQAGKGALPWDHPLQLGALGVTGSPAANALAAEADLVLAVGSRLTDFTTGSHSLFARAARVNLNVARFDAHKWGGIALVAGARPGLQGLSQGLRSWRAEPSWYTRALDAGQRWRSRVEEITTSQASAMPVEAEIIGAIQRSSSASPTDDIVVGAAGSLPAELHKLWRVAAPGGYHVEYGYSCMGYEIAGGLGVKMARPEREVVVMVGDGSYMMMSSELATSAALARKLIVIVLNNSGYACIDRLQRASGGASFNNLLDAPAIDFAAHAASMGVHAENVTSIDQFESAMTRARAVGHTSVICIRTDPGRPTRDGGWWWDVAIPEVSDRAEVRVARAAYERARVEQMP